MTVVRWSQGHGKIWKKIPNVKLNLSDNRFEKRPNQRDMETKGQR